MSSVTAKNNKSGNGSIVSAAVILGAASLASRLVGLFRERVLTTTFGAGETFDAFVAAFRIPDLIFNLIVIGALSAAFIPLFTEKLVRKRDNEQDAFHFANATLNVIMVAVVIFSALYALLTPYIVPIITPGFSGRELELTIQLSRVMALQPVLLAVSFVFSGVLNSFKRFVAYAMAPILYNVGIVIGVVWLVPKMGPVGLGWGVVLGALLHMAVQLPSMLTIGWRWQFGVKSSWTDLMRLWKMMVPRAFGLAAQQIDLLLVTFFGSGLLAGSITAFHLATNVQSLPIGIFGIAFAQAAFPTLSELAARKESHEFRQTLTRTFRYILFCVVPVSALFFLFRAQIVRVLFGDGAFDWQDTTMTFNTFGFLIISIFAEATIPLLSRAFFAKQDTKTPVVISLASIVLDIVFVLLFTPQYGVEGLALAFSLSAILQLLALLGILHHQLHGFDDRTVLGSLVRIVIATLLASLVAQLLKYPVAAIVDMQRFWGVLTQLLVAGGCGVLTYLGISSVIGSPEIVAIRKYLPRRFQLPVTPTDTTRFSGLSE